MASNQTERFKLNLWEPEDEVLREEFNDNTRKTEAAITQTFAQAFSVDNPPFVMGSYVGDGTSGREIVLGFHPRFVLAMGTYSGHCAVQLYTDDGMWSVSIQGSRDPKSHLTERGFFISSYSLGNSDGYVVPYVAFR